MRTAYQRITEALRDEGKTVRTVNGTTVAQCPAHDDRNPSLAIRDNHGQALVYCHAGCSTEDVVNALGLTLSDLFDDRRSKTYRYDDLDGSRLRDVVRSFNGSRKTRTTLYRLPEVVEAVDRGDQIHLVEGEKDADLLVALGRIGTTGPQGASNFHLVDVSPLEGANVVAVVDNDEAGGRWAGTVAAKLDGVAASVRFVRALEGNDTTDHVMAGHTVDELVPIEVTPAKSPTVVAGGPPVLGEEALYGLVGDFVRTVEPHTEADRAALLVSFLAAIGNTIGMSPHVRVGATRHRPNVFVLLIGATAKARKGTSWAETSRVTSAVDETWFADCVTSGLGSGEALIVKVADDPEQPGMKDPRALVIEEEFARLLAVGRREGSTLSTVVREAWDGRPLRNNTKANPLEAKTHLISVIGHITADETHAKITELDVANGLLNRFLIVYVQRSKLLPSGGTLRDEDLDGLIARTRRVVDTARKRSELRRTPAAERRWAEMYEEMADDDPGGLLGAVLARAEAQTLRLSLLYAVLDEADAIDVPHLEAAYALWRYCRDSAAYIFGDALGDPVADRIYAALVENPDGLDRTQLRDLFGRHVRRNQMDTALDLLRYHRRIEERTEETGGRPRTIYTTREKNR